MHTHMTNQHQLAKRKSGNESRATRRVDRAAQTKEARQRNLATVQLKQALPAVVDSYEREADQVADKVVRRQAASRITLRVPICGRNLTQCEVNADKKAQINKTSNSEVYYEEQTNTRSSPEAIHRKTVGNSANEDKRLVANLVHPELTAPANYTLLQALHNPNGGSPLIPYTRMMLESSMDADLSVVRVHDDAAAHKVSSGLNARAFTHRNDIWLGAGESQHDLWLMAHEAVHVVQQEGATSNRLQCEPNEESSVGMSPKRRLEKLYANRELKVNSIRKFDKDLEEMTANIEFLAIMSNIYSIEASEFSSSVDPLEIASDLSIAFATVGVTIVSAPAGLAFGVGGIFLDEAIGSEGSGLVDLSAAAGESVVEGLALTHNISHGVALSCAILISAAKLLYKIYVATSAYQGLKERQKVLEEYSEKTRSLLRKAFRIKKAIQRNEEKLEEIDREILSLNTG